MVLVRILMSKSGFKDEVLIKLIVEVVKHVTSHNDNNKNKNKKEKVIIIITIILKRKENTIKTNK
jgi:hypothetical protein